MEEISTRSNEERDNARRTVEQMIRYGQDTAKVFAILELCRTIDDLRSDLTYVIHENGSAITAQLSRLAEGSFDIERLK